MHDCFVTDLDKSLVLKHVRDATEEKYPKLKTRDNLAKVFITIAVTHKELGTKTKGQSQEYSFFQ